jgi:AcrR family transcriptional regulator
MAKIKQSPKWPPEKRRNQLLAAAQKLFQRKGYRGTTTDEIARRAGVTKGALYYHFKTKEDVLLGILENMSCRYQEALESVAPEGASPADFLRAIMETHPSKDLSDFRTLMDMWVQGMRIAKIRRYLAERMNEGIELFADRLDRRYGRTRQERRQMAVLTFSFYDGLAARKSVNPGPIDVDEQVRLFGRLMEKYRSSISPARREK